MRPSERSSSQVNLSTVFCFVTRFGAQSELGFICYFKICNVSFSDIADITSKSLCATKRGRGEQF